MKTRPGGADGEVKMKDVNEDDRKKIIHSRLEKNANEKNDACVGEGGASSCNYFQEGIKSQRSHRHADRQHQGCSTAPSGAVTDSTGAKQTNCSSCDCSAYCDERLLSDIFHRLKPLLTLQTPARRETMRPSSR